MVAPSRLVVARKARRALGRAGASVSAASGTLVVLRLVRRGGEIVAFERSSSAPAEQLVLLLAKSGEFEDRASEIVSMERAPHGWKVRFRGTRMPFTYGLDKVVIAQPDSVEEVDASVRLEVAGAVWENATRIERFHTSVGTWVRIHYESASGPAFRSCPAHSRAGPADLSLRGQREPANGDPQGPDSPDLRDRGAAGDGQDSDHPQPHRQHHPGALRDGGRGLLQQRRRGQRLRQARRCRVGLRRGAAGQPGEACALLRDAGAAARRPGRAPRPGRGASPAAHTREVVASTSSTPRPCASCRVPPAGRTRTRRLR